MSKHGGGAYVSAEVGERNAIRFRAGTNLCRFLGARAMAEPKRLRMAIDHLKQDSDFLGFHHLEWYVGNAKMNADWYVRVFGFRPLAYRGLETGHRQGTATHVVKRNEIVFAFTSSLGPSLAGEESKRVNDHISKHGDGVKDVAFHVRDCRRIYRQAIAHGAVSVREPHEEQDGKDGTVITATIATYGDTVHTLIQKVDYTGGFLPGFKPYTSGHTDVNADDEERSSLHFIDHVVGNQGEGEMTRVADWYKEKLGFHRFWTVDDKQIHTEFSSLRSIVMADDSLRIKMPINEPAPGKRKSQIQEYVDFYGGPGVQHIALNTPNCVETVQRLKRKGVNFLTVPSSYYKTLGSRLKGAGIVVKEELELIEQNNILVDFDDSGYLLQIFTKPLQDRPTVFLEIIQRAGNEGFGAGNFKALFEAIERDQFERGNT